MKPDEIFCLIVIAVVIFLATYKKATPTQTDAVQEVVQTLSEPTTVSEYLSRNYPNAA